MELKIYKKGVSDLEVSKLLYISVKIEKFNRKPGAPCSLHYRPIIYFPRVFPQAVIDGGIDGSCVGRQAESFSGPSNILMLPLLGGTLNKLDGAENL
ncbi:hypothetical protein CEXT_750111 [Caerostris extrusa]|uniref:Uncharacterized protein n=1 Tax=Caerostris extrusa TaxID=172846 RepID=A0AAV4NTS1_CAEEX|nr:hypothetical protein CEXT_750111 [Caerostris extrusa]